MDEAWQGSRGIIAEPASHNCPVRWSTMVSSDEDTKNCSPNQSIKASLLHYSCTHSEYIQSQNRKWRPQERTLYSTIGALNFENRVVMFVSASADYIVCPNPFRFTKICMDILLLPLPHCWSVKFLKTNISQGSEATCFRCDGIFNSNFNFIANVRRNVSVKKF